MITIAIAVLLLAGWTNSAKTSSVVNKRDAFVPSTFFPGFLGENPFHHTHHKIIIPAPALPAPRPPPFKIHYKDPQIEYGLNNFGSFLPSLHDSNYHSYAPQLTSFSSGYQYDVPLGPQFSEEPQSDSFNLIIPPAQMPMPMPNQKFMPPRRILTSVNQNLFYQYPGHIPDPGSLVVRVPITMTRPTRVVVPQHGRIAFGSGGLGYRTLPGGKIALGSGSVGLANLAMARAVLSDPKVASLLQDPNIQTQTVLSPPTPPPFNAPYAPSFDPAPSSNSLTVFPLTDQQKKFLFA